LWDPGIPVPVEDGRPNPHDAKSSAARLASSRTGVAAGSHVPETPRITFNRRSRRVREGEPTTVAVPRADLSEGGRVVVHRGRHVDHGDGDHEHGEGHAGDHHVVGHSSSLEPRQYGGLKPPVAEREGLSFPGTRTLTVISCEDDGDEEFNHPPDDSHYTDPDGSGPVRDVAGVTFRQYPASAYRSKRVGPRTVAWNSQPGRLTSRPVSPRSC
jgi:hypothetical protein